jgi:deoxyadenosine/deoxycytidine kinase
MLISIEGNIGSGKSTVIEYLKTQTKYKLIFVDEPVNEWLSIKDNNNNNALECFYKDQKKNAFCFQVLAYITRLKKLLDVIKNNQTENLIIVTERSIETDRNVFAKMLYEDNIISSIEWETYNYWFTSFKDVSKVDKILYIKTDPDKCLERINIRHREEESDIKLNYLVKCHNYHENWISSSQTEIITIDGHQNIDDIRNKAMEIISLI